jgi:ERCC4-type nuclease
MCDHLDTRGVPYVVRELKIADYVFFVEDKLAPVLIERKTAEDVAGSLHDGRWERQQRSMRKAQYVLGGGEARKCQICYIIEGDANKRKVHGGNVGRRSWFQGVEDVENAIDSLPSLGFSVMRSKGHLDTIGILAKVAADVSWKVKNGM